MSRGDELLAAIRASEDDDQPRLIYADWLEQEGHLSRADLIRRQCQLAREPAWSRHAVEARHEVEHLVAQHGATWRAELTPLEGVTWHEFERGFVASVKVDDVTMLDAYAEAIHDAAPVHSVELAALTAAVAPREIPWLRTLRLRLSWDESHDATIRNLMPSVRTLEIVTGDQRSAVLGAIAGTLALDELRLVGEHTMASGIVAQMAERLPGKPRVLRLGTEFIDHDTGYYLDPTLRLDGAVTLAKLGLHQVEVLDLAHQRITNDGFEAIIASHPAVRDLDVRGCELKAFPELDLPYAPLVRFRASDNPLGNAAFARLVAADRLAACEVLDVATCELGPDAMRALVAAPCWHTLRTLDVSTNPLGAAGVSVLADAPAPAALHTLNLAASDLGEDALAGCAWLGQLLELDLTDCAVSADALAALSSIRVLKMARAIVDGDAPYLDALWPHLVHADLRATRVTFADAPELQTLRLARCAVDLAQLARCAFPRLRVLDLSHIRMTARDLATIFESPLAQVPLVVLADSQLDAEATSYLARHGAGGVKELDLIKTKLEVGQLLELARSPALRATKLYMHGNPWNYPAPAREELEKRFGENWFYFYSSFTAETAGEDE